MKVSALFRDTSPVSVEVRITNRKRNEEVICYAKWDGKKIKSLLGTLFPMDEIVDQCIIKPDKITYWVVRD